MPTRCGVLGRPIEHSLSPVLHRAAYAELGLDWTYDAVEVGGADELAGFLDGLGPQWRGLSLTMPLKRMVVPLVDELDDWTQLSGVANTVLLSAGRRSAHNTDIGGAIAALRPYGSFARAAVLGGGATATSVLLALAELGCTTAALRVREPARAAETVEVVNRHRAAPALLVDSLDLPGTDVDVLVSTIPAAAQTPELVAAWARVPVVFEVLYDPWPTPLARSVLDSGRQLVTGLDLLVAQAGLQVSLMTGRREVPLDAMRAAGERALAERAG